MSQGDTALVVYKYRLRPAENLVEMPEGARLLHVGSQGSLAFVWALVSLSTPVVRRMIVVVPTGAAFMAKREVIHIGTFTIREPDEPELVFHAFDCGERSA